MRFRSTLFVAVLASVLAVGGFITEYLYVELKVVVLDVLQDELRSQAMLVARILEDVPPADWQVGGPLDARVDALAEQLGVRISVIARDGRVLADSTLNGDALRSVENHATRPEVQDALRSGQGIAYRASSTVRDTLLYVARRLPDPPGGVVRVAMPTVEVGMLWERFSHALGVAAVVGLVLALALSMFAGRLARQPLAGLVRQARQLARSALPAPPREDEVQELARTLDTVRDELQDLMNAIASEREELAAIVKTLTAGLVLLDAQGRIVLMNPAFCELMGCNPSFTGRLIAEIVRQPELLRAIEEAREQRQPRRVRFELASGRQRFLDVSLVPLQRPSGPPSVLALFHDVSRLERIERLRKDFVANASHELRTPVASISACAESLLSDPGMPPAQRTRFLEMIQRNCGRLARLGQDLLDLARAEAERGTLHPAPTKLDEMLDRLEADLAESLARASVTIARDFAPGTSQLIVDPDALERILVNLLENAIRYSPPGDRVIVRTRPGAGAFVLLEVEDHGEGIPAQHLNRIFERFYRADRARSRRDGGTGLGLAIVKHLAEAHGGAVRAESQPGVRTVLTVELPRDASALETP
jgi:two-component system, OmpR family, phosphate regulon sensor histidine kinase PhoR